MYKKAYGIIKTLAPLHVGATAGEESGNLNLIFRDQSTKTGIIPGSSIRGRLRSEMHLRKGKAEANKWYGYGAESEQSDSHSESLVKFEYASVVWLPIFCPDQPIVWVSCRRLLKRYQRLVGNSIQVDLPAAYTGSQTLKALEVKGEQKLFFNFGFLTVAKKADLSPWFPKAEELPAVVVGDTEMAMIHDMALYRQSRVKLLDNTKKVDTKEGAFFNVEALPEETILAFPIALKEGKESKKWEPFDGDESGEIYLGGLESIGFGHCYLTLKEV